MPLTPKTLHQCLWALPDKNAGVIIRNWHKDQTPAPAIRTLFAKREHNFIPIFCLPNNPPLPLLRTRIALPHKFKETLSLPVVQIQLSFCAPIAVYGKAILQLSAQGYAFHTLKLPQVGAVTTPELLAVAQAIETYLQTSGIELLTQAQVAQPLPESLQAWNHKTVLDVLFIKDDYPY